MFVREGGGGTVSGDVPLLHWKKSRWRLINITWLLALPVDFADSRII